MEVETVDIACALLQVGPDAFAGAMPDADLRDGDPDRVPEPLGIDREAHERARAPGIKVEVGKDGSSPHAPVVSQRR